MKVFKFATGLAIGYVLGSRAGRDKYEQIVAAARKAQNHTTLMQVQQRSEESLDTTEDSLATGTSTDPAPLEAPTTAPSADPVPRPARRQPKTAPAVPDTANDPRV